LWPNVFVEESNITFNINKLRKALGDTNRPPLYIETVPRRGYRFKKEVNEVRKDLNDGISLAGPPRDSSTNQTETNLHSSRRKWTFVKLSVFVALSLLAITAVAAWRFHRASQTKAVVTQQSALRSPDKTDLKFEQI